MSRRRAAPPTTTGVGAGILDGPGWGAVWARQGCRALHGIAPPAGAHWHRCVGGWHSVLHWLMVYAVHPARVAARTMALGRGLRHLRMALWDAGGVSPAATGDRGVAPGPRDLGCTPLVGKSGRRGILRQAKVWLRRHTGCMTRRHTAGMAEKARRAPQTHGWWAALTRKKSSKTFYFWTIGGFTAKKTGHASNHRGAPGGGGDNKDY